MTIQQDPPTALEVKWLKRAWALGEQGQWQEMLRVLDQNIAEIAHQTPERGGVEWRGNQYEVTHDDATIVPLMAHPDYALAYGVALAHVGQYPEAINRYTSALQHGGAQAQALTYRAEALMALGDYQGAIVDAEEAVQWQPDFAKGWRTKGIAHSWLRQHRQALLAFEHAVDRDPTSALSWTLKGKELHWLKREPEALAAFDRAIDLAPADPANYEAWQGRYIVLRRQWRLWSAWQAYRTAVRLAVAHHDRKKTTTGNTAEIAAPD